MGKIEISDRRISQTAYSQISQNYLEVSGLDPVTHVIFIIRILMITLVYRYHISQNYLLFFKNKQNTS
jgi:hypothetical protein